MSAEVAVDAACPMPHCAGARSRKDVRLAGVPPENEPSPIREKRLTGDSGRLALMGWVTLIE
jgi:hypothetical protein